MRLIDIEPFETEANLTSCYISRTHSGDGFINVASTDTKEISTIDAVEVVRCAECKHYEDMMCQRWEELRAAEENDFCSYGERRSDVRSVSAAECCANCGYISTLKHNFTVDEGFRKSYCCLAMPLKYRDGYVVEVSPNDRCELFVRRVSDG